MNFFIVFLNGGHGVPVAVEKQTQQQQQTHVSPEK
jgi:hypothetical protein